jgi:hypothetical protein
MEPCGDCLIHLSSRSLRHSNRLWEHDTELLNILLRAYCLLAVLEDREPGVDDFLGGASVPMPENDPEKRRLESLRTAVGLLIPVLRARARVLVAVTDSGNRP